MTILQLLIQTTDTDMDHQWMIKPLGEAAGESDKG